MAKKKDIQPGDRVHIKPLDLQGRVVVISLHLGGLTVYAVRYYDRTGVREHTFFADEICLIQSP